MAPNMADPISIKDSDSRLNVVPITKIMYHVIMRYGTWHMKYNAVYVFVQTLLISQ